MENRDIARLLSETADLMEIAAEDSFRIRSYRNAAAVIESYPDPVAAILRDPEKRVTDIPGIGKGMASVLQEIEQRGSFERRDQMLALYPPTALEFLKIQGLGPKSIRTIWESTVLKNCARSRSCGACRGWARSWRRKFCGRSPATGSARADSC
jgi:DNA polymerase (family 10)